MKETLKQAFLIALTPILLALHYATGNVGFYNLAAAFIVICTTVITIAVALLWFFYEKDPIRLLQGATLPEKPKTALVISRIVSIFITTYLIWGGYWIIATVSVFSLIMSYVTWNLIDLINEEKQQLVAYSSAAYKHTPQ